MGTGSSPGRSREEDPGLDSLFAFGQEVCLEPAGRASREGCLGPQPRPPGWPGLQGEGGNGALCGHSWELAPNTERKAWLRGTGPRALGRHSPPCWAPGSLSENPSLPTCVRRAPPWGPPPGKRPRTSRTAAPEGTRSASRTSSPQAAAAGPDAWCPRGHFLGNEGRVPAAHLTPTPPAPEKPQVPPGSQPPCTASRPPACCLPPARPTRPARPPGPLL